MLIRDVAGVTPDPESAVDVLAFVLCPVSVFAPDCDADELDSLREIMVPLKRAAIERWQEAARQRHKS